MRSRLGSFSRMVKAICSPAAFTSLRSRTVQPASFSSANARRRPSRLLPLPSVTGTANGSVNNAGGRLSRKGASSAVSAGSGRPLASCAVLPK